MITNDNAHAHASGQLAMGAMDYTERSHYNTSSEAQRQRLLQFLIENGSANTIFCRDRINVMAPAARINELREQGHKIHTSRINITDRDGRVHPRVAVYSLLQLAEVTSHAD